MICVYVAYKTSPKPPGSVVTEADALYAEPGLPCVVQSYTQYTIQPMLETKDYGEYIFLRLATGEAYIQYKDVVDVLRDAFFDYRNGGKLLLYGPPRTGKSYAFKFFARASARKLYLVPTSSVLSKYLGETEKKIVAYIRRAHEERNATLFDEGEALIARRGSSMRYASFLSAMLFALNEYSGGGVVGVATNAKSEYIDDAAISAGRLEVVNVRLPTPAMLKTFAELVGVSYRPDARTVADLLTKRQHRQIHRLDYEILPTRDGPVDSRLAIEDVKGVYSIDLTTQNALALAWAVYGASRQVWFVYGARDPPAVLDAADEAGAVVVIDKRHVDTYVKYVYPTKALVILPGAGDIFPRLRYRYDQFAIQKFVRQCLYCR